MSAQTPQTPSAGLSRVPYLPGLDGLRAIAVVAVMIWHADHHWLDGGFLGVEVFFVISGYLITLLLLAEFEKSGRIARGQFYLRRARRLLPALYVMMAALAIYIAAFYPETRYDTRGDFLAGLFYVSNWYQIFVGQGYAAGEAFVPLRHLWSLAVEEQFYLVWPLVMGAILLRVRNPRRLPRVGLWFIGTSVFVSLVVAAVFVSGPVATSCGGEFNDGCWQVGDRWINVNEWLYLGSFSRSSGLLLGAGFALLWRPAAILRGPLRNRGRRLDLIAIVGMLLLVWFFWAMYLFEGAVYNPWLFRGGFFLTGLATLLVIAAATHEGAATGRLLGNPLFLWLGTRSYGLYLYHWPIYQIIRKQAQIELSVGEFILAMVLTCVVTEASYRYIETPIRKGQLRPLLRSVRRTTWTLVATLSMLAVLALAVVSFAVADDHCVGEVSCANEQNAPEETVPATQPSVPGDTTVTTATTTTVPKEPQAHIAIGESVMLGAAPQLQSAGVFVDAREDRGPEGVKNTVIKLRDAGDLGEGSEIVIQVGTNAPMSQGELDAIMAELPDDVGPVWFMTLHAPGIQWIPDNNELIRNMPNLYPGLVQVIDWDTESANVDLCEDDVHISCNGSLPAIQYTNLILEALQLPLLPEPAS